MWQIVYSPDFRSSGSWFMKNFRSGTDSVLRLSVFIFVAFSLLFSSLGHAQTCATVPSTYVTKNGAQSSGLLTTASEWSTSNPPYTLNVSNDSYTIPAGEIVEIASSNFDLDHNLIVAGTLLITGKLNLATGKTIIVQSGGLVTCCTTSSPGGCGTSDKISIGGTAAWSGSGGGGAASGGPFAGPTALTPTGFGNVYTWNGATSNWQTSTNWTPTRTSPNTADVLTFDASGTNKSITNIPTQTVTSMYVTGSSLYSFVPASSGNSLTLTSTLQNSIQIDNASTLSLGTGGNALNLTMPSGGTASIGGQLNLVNGNFGAGGATVVLHTNSTPLARTSGQMSLNSSSVLKFGDSGLTTGSVITLPNSIFVSAPTISSLIVNRTNGATLGDQSVTVNSGLTLTLGDLNTNAAGRIKFASSASNPTESTSSKIVGYAEMNLRSVNTGALTFLGLSLAAGADNVGSVTLVRRTGSSGINTFNSNQSIASSWDLTSSAEPVSGRNISFSWQSAFDNVTTASSLFQAYAFNSGPGWTPIGPLQSLASVGPPRQTVAVSITKLSDTFTVTDASQSLPVELVSFTAKAGFESAILEWVTSSELNFDYFSIQRSSNRKDFEEIGRVTGHGTTDERHEYSFVDGSVLVQKLYYRLKTVDFDGYTEYSNIATVDFSGSKAISVYPNPVEDGRLFAKFNFEPTGDTRIEITDMVGSRKLSQVLSHTGTELLIPITIEPGTYILRLKSGDFTSVERIVVK